MSEILRFPKDKDEQYYFLDHCAGCKKEIEEGENYTEIEMPYFNIGTKHIALCKNCDKSARKHGAY